MLASQENVYLTILYALNVSNESEKARIHTGFHRFTEIGQIVHNKYIFNTKNFVQVEIWKMVLTFFFTIFKASSEENGTSQYPF